MGTNNAEVKKIFRFCFDLASLRLSAERTSWFLSPKFLEKKFKKIQLCVISIEDIVSPRVTTEKGGIFIAFKVLVHSWSTTYAVTSSHYGSLVLLNLHVRMDEKLLS